MRKLFSVEVFGREHIMLEEMTQCVGGIMKLRVGLSISCLIFAGLNVAPGAQAVSITNAVLVGGHPQNEIPAVTASRSSCVTLSAWRMIDEGREFIQRAVSTDCGTNWSLSKIASDQVGGIMFTPKLWISSDGARMGMVWLSPFSVWASFSANRGSTWSEPQIVLRGARTPFLVGNAEGTYISLVAEVLSDDVGSNIVVVSSQDLGSTWSTAQYVTNLVQNRFTFPVSACMATDGKFMTVAAATWHSIEATSYAILKSSDSGSSWSSPSVVPVLGARTYNEINFESSKDCQVILSTQQSSVDLGGDVSDVYAAVSGDFGMSWTRSTRLATNDNLNDFDSVRSAISPDGKILFLTWKSEGQPNPTAGRLWKSSDFGKSWISVSTPATFGGGYYQDVSIDGKGLVTTSSWTNGVLFVFFSFNQGRTFNQLQLSSNDFWSYVPNMMSIQNGNVIFSWLAEKDSDYYLCSRLVTNSEMRIPQAQRWTAH